MSTYKVSTTELRIVEYTVEAENDLEAFNIVKEFDEDKILKTEMQEDLPCDWELNVDTIVPVKELNSII